MKPNTMPTVASVYAQFNVEHAEALRLNPRSPEYLERLERMESIASDARRAFGSAARRAA
jgi:hypothetical protein